MIYTKNSDGSIQSISGSQYITLSTYDKATITYPVNKVVYKTTTEKKQDTVVDADGNTIVLKEYEVEVPVLDEDNKPIVKEKVREMVRYNPYDEQGVVIIPDNAEVITEKEYNEFLQSFKK